MNRRTTLFISFSIVLILSLVTLPVGRAFAQVSPEDDEGAFGKKRTKRQFKFKSLRLRKKRRRKLLIKIRRKKTKRELEEERLRKEAEKQKKQGLFRVKGKSLQEEVDKQAAELAISRIKTFKEAIQDMEPGPQRSDLLFRLAEQYRELVRYYRLQALKEHSKKMDEWDKECRKIGDVKKCPPPPKPDLEKSEAYRAQAITTYKRILKEDPNFARADEVVFSLAMNLIESKKEEEGVKYLKMLLKKWPNSRLVPEAHMELGNYYFRKGKLADSEHHYKMAAKLAKKRFRDKNTPDDLKVEFRGLHLRALYYLGWTSFNAGDPERSLRYFKRVIKLSMRYEKTKESKILFKDEALNDMVRVYAKMVEAPVQSAYDYFRRIMGPEFAYKAIKRLAAAYYRETQYIAAIKTYRFLMKINEKGEPDEYSADTPVLQNEIVRSAHMIWPPDKIYREVLKMTSYLEEDNPWYKRWHNNKKVMEEARDAIEQTLLEFSTKYHQRAQDEKDPKKKEKFYDFAIQLYEQYVKYFPNTESAYELRFFLAELLYRKAEKLKGKRAKTPPEAAKYFARAARQYYLVVKQNPKGQYLKQAAFAEVLCYEHLANRTGGAVLRGAGKKLQGLKIDPKTGKVTWKRIPIKPGSWDYRLLEAYRRYLKIVKGPKHKEDRLQTYFKMGTIYYTYKHYLKAMKIFSEMAREFPNHELSRRAAFMILYSYEDLRQWDELDKNARQFLKDKVLTKNKRFKQEMYEMLIRSAFLRIKEEMKDKKLPPLEVARRYVAYEREFGKEGPWVTKKGFPPSPAADRALALAGLYFTKGKRILEAIRARERLIKLYKESPLREQIIYELGQQYEEMAEFDTAASWYEKYVFGDKDYMQLYKEEFESDGKKKAKRRKKRVRKVRKRRKRRAKRPSRRKDFKSKKLKIDPKVIEKQRNNALYKAAIYRRGLAQFKRAIALYRFFIKYFPEDKTVPDSYLAIAEVYEELKDWDRAIAAYSEYLEKYQPKAVERYLQKALKLQKQYLDKVGIFTRHTIPKNPPRGYKDDTALPRQKLGKLKVEDVSDGKIIHAYAKIASIYRKLKKIEAMEELYMKVDALGYQMYILKAKPMHGLSPARAAYSEAKFFLAERRRRAFLALKFVGNQRKDKRVLKEIIKQGKILTKDYNEVIFLQYPEWVLAAAFRQGEIYHLFVKKLYAAPMPRDLPKRLWPQYKMALENFAMRFEEIAIDAYNNVLKKSAELGLYNEWVLKCEKALNEINRQSGKINPYTIFRKRETHYWLVEPKLDVIDFEKLLKEKKKKEQERQKLKGKKSKVKAKKLQPTESKKSKLQKILSGE